MQKKSPKPLIGILTASAYRIEQRQLLEGIIAQAQEFDIDTAVFSNIYNLKDYYAHIEVENMIYELMLSEKLDGLILAAESFLNEEVQQDIYQKLIIRSDIPVVVTGAVIPGMTCINNDVRSDFRDITNHLIEVHNFSDIDILTGFENNETSVERVNGCKDAMESHGINFDKDKVIYGNFWMNSGEELAEEYISGKRKFPQAIICANDYMAYGLCDVFTKNNIRVPDDVSIIGYEYINERYVHVPILTTYKRNRNAIGRNAVRIIYSLITGKSYDELPVSGVIVHGDTCKCGSNLRQLSAELSDIRNGKFYMDLNLSATFNQQLTLCRSLTDYIHTLQEFTYLIRGATGLYLCLYEEWCRSEMITDFEIPVRHNDMICCRVMSTEGDIIEPVLFSRQELYPEVIPKSISGNILYFCPIFFSGKDLGYFIIQYDKPDVYDVIFRDWLKIASSALEFLRIKNDISTLLECRNLSDFYDALTGLYNKSGFEDCVQRAINSANPDDSVMLILMKFEFHFGNNLEQQRINIKIQMEVADTLKKLNNDSKVVTAKISDNLCAVLIIGRYSAESSELFADMLKTIIEHSPIYFENCYMNTIETLTYFKSVNEFDYSKAYAEVRERLSSSGYSRKIDGINIDKYVRLRNDIYHAPGKNWNLQEICSDFLLSCGHFRVIYKSIFGISFHQDLIQSRISLAKYLLLTTSMSVSAVAYECGYDDDKYFMRQFKQITGITPNLYRSIKIK